jgi:hypothetical protein
VYLDFAPLFCGWKADFGRTYELATHSRQQQFVHDIAAAFRKGNQRFLASKSCRQSAAPELRTLNPLPDKPASV